MRTLRVVVAGLGLAVVGSGCMSAAQSARMYAASELRCPAANIQVEELASSTFRARGCGREAYYLDNNAPVASATPPASGRLHWRFASSTPRR